MISIVVLTHNEEANLPRCLASVVFSDDIWIVDSGSTDRTLELAQAAGAHVVARAFDSFAAQRNFAMVQDLRHGWVLHLDADEVVTPELQAELLALASANAAPYPVYKVPSRLIFMGRWLRHAGMYPAYQVRFGRADALRFVDHGHGQREIQDASQVGTLQAPLDHHNFSKGINDWFQRHLRYARLEASEVLNGGHADVGPTKLFSSDPTVRRRTLKALAARLPARPLLRFLYSYIVRGGFLDGRPGYHYSRMLAIYQYLIDLNLLELTTNMTNKNKTRSRL